MGSCYLQISLHCMRCVLSNKHGCNLHQDGGLPMTTDKLELRSIVLNSSPISLLPFKAQHGQMQGVMKGSFIPAKSCSKSGDLPLRFQFIFCLLTQETNLRLQLIPQPVQGSHTTQVGNLQYLSKRK